VLEVRISNIRESEKALCFQLPNDSKTVRAIEYFSRNSGFTEYSQPDAGIHATFWPQAGERAEELQFLARRLSYLSPDQLNICKIALSSVLQPTTESLINLTYNLDEFKKIEVGNDKDLGKTLLSGNDDVLDTLLSGEELEIPDWIRPCIDPERLGEQFRIDYHGKYIGGFLVTPVPKEFDFERIYRTQKGNFPDVLKDIPCLLKINLVNGADYTDDFTKDEGVWLKLPAEQEWLEDALHFIGVSSQEDCCVKQIFSTIKELDGYRPETSEYDQLNTLALKLEKFNSSVIDLKMGPELALLKYEAILQLEMDKAPFQHIADFLNCAERMELYEYHPPESAQSPQMGI
jgi:hypothetical protein